MSETHPENGSPVGHKLVPSVKLSFTDQNLPHRMATTQLRTFRGLSTKFCFFCCGFLVGLFAAVLLLAAFLNEETQLRTPSSSRSGFGRSLVSTELTTIRPATPSPTNSSLSVEEVITTEWTTTVITYETLVDNNRTESVVIPQLRPEVSAEDLNSTDVSTQMSSEEISTQPPITETTTQVITVSDVTTIETTTPMTHFSSEETTLITGTTEEPTLTTGSTEKTTEGLPLNETMAETTQTTPLGIDSPVTHVVPEEVTYALNASNSSSVTTLTPNVTSEPTTEVTSPSTPLTSANVTNETFCSSAEFLCPGESLCLPRDELCDGKVDCPLDGFDESACNSCGANFRCGNFCVSRQNYCDGLWDCHEGEDELGCHVSACPSGEFLCKDLKRCIKGKHACDHVSHCDDHSDEIGCLTQEKCEQINRFFCKDGLCIDRALRCDQNKDCADGSDEVDCDTQSTCSAKEGFLCENNECIPREKRCDRKDDCGDGSDEWLCVTRDSNHTVLAIAQNAWRPLCPREGFTAENADALCHRMGQWEATNWTVRGVTPVDNYWATEDNRLSPDCPRNETLVLECGQRECGLPQNDSSPGFAAPLRVSDNSSYCLGHPVSANWLLMSADCISKLSEDALLIQDSIPVQQVMVHFRHSHFRRFPDYDIALVRSNQTLEATPLCLPPHAIDPAITCFAGEDKPLEVMESALCNSSRHFAGSLTSRHLCASSARGACLSEGQPLMCLSSSSRWHVAGFQSFCYSGHVTHPSLFSNVFSVKQWILKVIGRQTVAPEEGVYRLIEETAEEAPQTVIPTNSDMNSTAATEATPPELTSAEANI